MLSTTAVKSNGSNEIIRVNSRVILYVTTIVTANAQTLIAVSTDSTFVDDRVAAMADLYRFYRCIKASLTFHRVGASEMAIVAATMGGDFTAPTTLAEVLALPVVGINWHQSVAPTHLNLSPAALRGQFQWFNTEGSGDPSIDTQGYLVIASLAATALNASHVYIQIDSTFELRERLPAASSLKRNTCGQAMALPMQLLPQSDDYEQVTETKGEDIDYGKNRGRSSPPSVRKKTG